MEKLFKQLHQHNLDILIITKRENVRYLTGFTGTFGVVIITREKALFLTDPRYTQQAAKECEGWEIRELRGEKLSQWLKREFSPKRVGVEEWLQIGVLERLKKELNAEFTVVFHAVEELRESKSEHEVEYIKKALNLAESAFQKILPLIKPGVSERELALELEFTMRKEAEGTSFDIIVASGARSSMPHGVASHKKVEKGDIIVFDFGCKVNGYCSDITRVVKVGRCNKEELKIWSIVNSAHQKAVEAIAKGERNCRKIHQIAHQVIEEAGYGKFFGHGLGHGVGLEIHEKPYIGSLSEDTLKEGAVFTIEPGIYLPDKIGIRLENMYWLNKDEPLCLNHLPLEIIELE